MDPTQPPLVLVTGSSGLIGSRLVRALAPRFRVVGLDVVEPDDLPASARFEPMDLTDARDVLGTLLRVRTRYGPRVAAIVHLAAYYDFSGEPSRLYEELTVEGSRRLVRAAADTFDHLERIVFSSSTLVMAPSPDGQPITEESPREGKWDYPRSKIRAEDVLAAERGDIPLAVLRLAGVYDEWGHSPPLTHHLWRIAERGLASHLFPGDPSCVTHYVHLDDAVRALRLAVERRHELAAHEVLLIAEERGVSYAELQDAFGRLLWDEPWGTTEVPSPLARAGAAVQQALGIGDPFIQPWMVPMADDDFPLSVERAKGTLGWTAKKALLDVLPAMVDNMRRDPERFYAVNELPGEAPSALLEEV